MAPKKEVVVELKTDSNPYGVFVNVSVPEATLALVSVYI